VDTIRVLGLQFMARHGVHPEEKTLPQLFEVDVEVCRDLTIPAGSDRLDDTVNYSRIVSAVRTVMEGEPCNLLERLAGKIIENLSVFITEGTVTVRVRKPRAPLPIPFHTVEIQLHCEMKK
jgi:7,8-dihydroneopterin aldolase/epimerase/oxygenase